LPRILIGCYFCQRKTVEVVMEEIVLSTPQSLAQQPAVVGSIRRQTPRRARIAVATTFFITGMTFATWAARIPAVSEQLHLTPGTLGIALFGLNCGSLLSLPISGTLVVRLRSRTTAFIGFLFYCLLFPLLGMMPNVWALACMLGVYALGSSLTNIAINVAGVAVEQRYNRPLMGSFHAFWSFGGVAGSLIGAGAASINMPVWLHFGLMSIV
jgi:MFS family permease